MLASSSGLAWPVVSYHGMNKQGIASHMPQGGAIPHLARPTQHPWFEKMKVGLLLHHRKHGTAMWHAAADLYEQASCSAPM